MWLENTFELKMRAQLIVCSSESTHFFAREKKTCCIGCCSASNLLPPWQLSDDAGEVCWETMAAHLPRSLRKILSTEVNFSVRACVPACVRAGVRACRRAGARAQSADVPECWRAGVQVCGICAGMRAGVRACERAGVRACCAGVRVGGRAGVHACVRECVGVLCV